MNNMQDVTTWVGLVDEADADDIETRRPCSSLLAALGFRPAMTPLVRNVVSIPLALWDAALLAWRVVRATRASDGSITTHPTLDVGSNPTSIWVIPTWTWLG